VPLCHGRRAVTSTATESPKVVELRDTIAGPTLEEARSLVDHMQERLDVSATVAMPGVGGVDTEEAAPAEK
jgi:large subunit ribosomal protein L7/L12